MSETNVRSEEKRCRVEQAIQRINGAYPGSNYGRDLRMAENRMKKQVLIVDDDESVCIGMSEILRDEGFDVHYTMSGKEAVEAVKSRGYNVVFMDMIMPLMNGLQTFREIKKIKPAARVILFTGYFRDAEDVVLQGIKEGMIDEFIRKPFFADEIIKAARKYI